MPLTLDVALSSGSLPEPPTYLLYNKFSLTDNILKLEHLEIAYLMGGCSLTLSYQKLVLQKSSLVILVSRNAFGVPWRLDIQVASATAVY